MIKIKMNPELADLIPGYLKSATDDVEKMEKAIAQSDFQAIKNLSHKMKGVAESYGFPVLTQLGKKIETAAVGQKADEIKALLKELKEYISKIELV